MYALLFIFHILHNVNLVIKVKLLKLPNIYNGVQIAKALGTTAEQLVDGQTERTDENE